MKNKNNLIIVGSLLLVLIIIAIVLLTTSGKDKEPSKYSIIYSYGGGFGTYADSLKREITIYDNGNVTIDLENHEVKVEPISYVVDKDKVEEVFNYLIDNGFKDMKEDLSSSDVLDAGSSYIEIKSDTLNKKVGGYAAFTNKKYSKMSKKVNELIDDMKLEEFDKRVDKAVEK